MENQKNNLNKADYKKIAWDAMYFFSFPLGFYITAILITISLPNHILSLADFIPSNATMILIVGWAGNTALNALRKFRAG